MRSRILSIHYEYANNMEAAIISGVVTVVGFFIAFLRWKHEVNLKIEEIKEEVTSELIKQRIEPYITLTESIAIISLNFFLMY
ncbi:MAG: hypothetical protein AAFR66_18000 [Bacteroidota bacterium]